MYLFVYGTLRKHGINHDTLAGSKVIATQAWSHGSLYDSEQGYPYFLEGDAGRVYGEVYEIDEETLRAVDELEKFYGKDDDEYKRMDLRVHTDHLGWIDVMSYQNHRVQVHDKERLRFGDWIAHLELPRTEHTYFAYGSCMDHERFRLAGVDHLFTDCIGGAVTDRLEMNYTLRVKDGGRANIMETGNPGEGVLYRVNQEAVAYLFEREGVDAGMYRPAFIDVKVGDSLYEKSLTFIVLDPVEETAPPLHYATEIIRGSKGIVSDSYHKKLTDDLKKKFNVRLDG